MQKRRTVRITVIDLNRNVNHQIKAVWDRKIVTEFTRSISSMTLGQKVITIDVEVSKDKYIRRWFGRKDFIYVKWESIKNCTKKKMIDRWKRSKTPNEVKPVGDVNKNTQCFLGISHEQKEVPPSYKLEDHEYEQQHLFQLKEDNLSQRICQNPFSLPTLSHKGRMSSGFDSRKDWQPPKLERLSWILVKLSFRDSCDLKLPISEVIFCDLYWEFIFKNKWHPGYPGISTPPEIAVGTQFHAWLGMKTSLVFLHADGKASWSLLQKFGLRIIKPDTN